MSDTYTLDEIQEAYCFASGKAGDARWVALKQNLEDLARKRPSAPSPAEPEKGTLSERVRRTEGIRNRDAIAYEILELETSIHAASEQSSDLFRRIDGLNDALDAASERLAATAATVSNLAIRVSVLDGRKAPDHNCIAPAPPPAEPATGIYRKFLVERTDGSSAPGGKHENCDYFVLDWAHDKYAVPAAIAYARACKDEYPELAADLSRRAGDTVGRLDNNAENRLTPSGPPDWEGGLISTSMHHAWWNGTSLGGVALRIARDQVADLETRLADEQSKRREAEDIETATREERDDLRERLATAEKERDKMEDCGQNGVCAISPGCVRHWLGRNLELAKEREELRGHGEWLQAQIATRDARIAGLEKSAAEDSKARAALEGELAAARHDAAVWKSRANAT
jgi:hypothetical protein